MPTRLLFPTEEIERLLHARLERWESLEKRRRPAAPRLNWPWGRLRRKSFCLSLRSSETISNGVFEAVPPVAKIQKRGSCVFCGGFGLSKEHVFADWMRDHLPNERVRPHHEITRFQHNDSFQPIGRTRSSGNLSRRQGPLRSVKLRVVCENCNNGWMSELQKKTKPILVGFLQGKWRKLTPNEQRILAAWAVMFTMVLEYGDRETSATSQEQREYLMKHERAQALWYVWMGRFAHNTSLYRYHAFRGRTKVPGVMTDKCVAQATFFVAGRAAFLTLSSSDGSVGPRHLAAVGRLARSTNLRRIWPPSALFRGAPPHPIPFDALQVWILGDALVETIRVN